MSELSLDNINAAIETLVAKGKLKYKEGDVEVDMAEQLKQLRLLRTDLLANPEAEIDMIAFDFDINEFGEDKTQYEL